MIVILHVVIALASIAFTSLAYFAPTVIKLRVAYGLMALTLTSGMYLIISEPAHMLESCTVGVAYLTIVAAGIVAARRRLSSIKTIS